MKLSQECTVTVIVNQNYALDMVTGYFAQWQMFDGSWWILDQVFMNLQSWVVLTYLDVTSENQ